MVAVADLRAGALSAAAHGWSVFPIWPGSKIPALHSRAGCPGTDACRDGHRGWEQRATTDVDRIRRCWARRPFNVGIAAGPSGLVVLDLDVPAVGQTPPPPWNHPGVACGEDVFLLVCAEAGQVPPLDTYTVATPSGGVHLYYRQPPGVRIRNSVSRSRRIGDGTAQQRGLGWKIDIRAVGGQVLAAGSHIRGRRYRVLRNAPVADLPSWLVERLSAPTRSACPTVPADMIPSRVLRPSSYAAAVLVGEIDKVLAAEEGCRNDTLNIVAYTLGHHVRNGLIPERLAYDVLAAAGQAIGLSEKECHATIRSGLSAGQRTS